ncbi:hypothetical protein NM208_g13646 [Fusarium decemcellulare]|uniref:Uncharacterized protein n=1 Tax=Fusarium decemcellulare TaxID=57161 RepID=A0ACC1RMI3_9HYPO|nr:hypothetical protein NM208_g13646 [Fusarium decemcellulare]
MQVQPVRPKRDGEGTDLDMFSRPPLEGLLRVLADPYLLSARLWVDARHARTWCRFHAGGCSAGTAVEGWTGSGTREREREREGEVVEIDWREVLRVVDPERKDIAVAVATEKKWSAKPKSWPAVCTIPASKAWLLPSGGVDLMPPSSIESLQGNDPLVDQEVDGWYFKPIRHISKKAPELEQLVVPDEFPVYYIGTRAAGAEIKVFRETLEGTKPFSVFPRG